jgi:hypothetical protein
MKRIIIFIVLILLAGSSFAGTKPADINELNYRIEWQAADSARITLEWDHDGNNTDHYNMHMKVGTGFYSIVGTIDVDLPREWSITILKGVDYYFQVDAENQWGISPKSNELHLDTTAPAQPVSLGVKEIIIY